MDKKKELTDEEKKVAIERAKEIGIHAAAKEIGMPWQSLAKLYKDAGNPPIKDTYKKTPKKKGTSTKNKKVTVSAKNTSDSKSKPIKSDNIVLNNDVKTATEKSTKSYQLEVQNAILKAENETLKAENVKLRKALAELSALI